MKSHEEKSPKKKWTSENHLIKQKILLMQKEIESQIFCHLKYAEFKEIALDGKRFMRHADIQLKVEEHDILNFLKSVSKKVKELQMMTSEIDRSRPELYLEQIKTLMEDVENDIISFKQKQKEKYELISAEERSLDKDLRNFSKQISEWSSEGQELEKKKLALERWKERKIKEREEILQKETDNSLKDLERQDTNRRLKEKKKRMETMKRLEEWKKKKKEEEEELKKEEEKKRFEEKIARLEEEKKKLEIKQKVLQYQKEKARGATPREKQAMEQLRRSPRPPSRSDFERMQKRDMEMIQKKEELRAKKMKEKEERQELQQQIAKTVQIEARRDFSRVIRNTEAHSSRIAERVVQGHETDTTKTNFNIKKVQHLSVPSWRRGLG